MSYLFEITDGKEVDLFFHLVFRMICKIWLGFYDWICAERHTYIDFELKRIGKEKGIHRSSMQRYLISKAFVFYIKQEINRMNEMSVHPNKKGPSRCQVQ